jgi:hypothetical protein
LPNKRPAGAGGGANERENFPARGEVDTRPRPSSPPFQVLRSVQAELAFGLTVDYGSSVAVRRDLQEG